ncbi:hypothetical protein GN956_G10872 [Arapaima gigas]
MKLPPQWCRGAERRERERSSPPTRRAELRIPRVAQKERKVSWEELLHDRKHLRGNSNCGIYPSADLVICTNKYIFWLQTLLAFFSFGNTAPDHSCLGVQETLGEDARMVVCCYIARIFLTGHRREAKQGWIWGENLSASSEIPT